MTLIKRKGIYHARIKSTESKSGYVSITTKETDKDRAKARIKESGLDKVESAAQTHRLTHEGVARILAGKRVTVESAMAEWRKAMTNAARSVHTIERSVSVVHHFASDTGLLKAAPMSITTAHIHQWINDPKSEQKATTRKITLSILGSFLEYCTYAGWNMGNAAKLVSVDMGALSHEQKETRPILCFTKAEVEKLASHAEGFWKFATLIGYETGMRMEDVATLEWGSFDHEGKVVVHTRKRDKRVVVPISERVSLLVHEIPIQHNTYLFPEQRATAMDPKNRAKHCMQFKRLCETCGIEGKTFHSLRHTRVTAWRKEFQEDGLSYEDALLKVGKLLGHSHLSTTKGYDHA